MLTAVVDNGRTPDDTIARIAETCSERVTEVIAANEVRLLRTPSIIEKLFLNPASRQSSVDRAIDLARRNQVSLEGLPAIRMLLGDKRAISDRPDDEIDIAHEQKEDVTGLEDDLFAQVLQESLEEAARDAGGRRRQTKRTILDVDATAEAVRKTRKTDHPRTA